MGRYFWLILLAVSGAFALNLDSLPVWNPAYLVQHNVTASSPAGDSAALPQEESRLETHGYKTMQVTVGDGSTQVDQELRLSIQGTVGDSVQIDALLSDVDRKAGDQTTATLQEVDQIYFRAESRHWLLHLGDFTWTDDSLGLYSLERSTLGGMVGFRGGHSEVRGAFGTDEVNRLTRVMNGVSGQREGYSVSDGGDYISVVPQSEEVWLNGVKLSRGTDYEMNYAGGLIDFVGTRVPGPDDEIRVEYDAYEDENIYRLYAASGKYRHPNLYLDVSGFRLENDRNRLKRGVWTDEEYAALKADRGGLLFRSNDSLPGGVDSLSPLNRPERTERAGARMRLQADHRYYADLELAMNRQDSNTVSDKIGGPRGEAFRWYLTTDSSAQMKKFPVAFSLYGNYIQEGFNINEFQGNDLDWNAYKLSDEWDLDSALIGGGDLRHDELGMRIRLGSGWFVNSLWGYRQGEDETWNSSRGRVALSHENQQARSEIGFVHVASLQETETERFQAVGSADFLQGLFRPFGNFDVRYTQVDDYADEIAYGKGKSGFQLVGEWWNASEGVETKWAQNRGTNYTDDWSDSLKSVAWTQTAEVHSGYLDVSHFLQYERRTVNDYGAENSWVGDLNADFGDDEIGITGNANYKLGLTEEQTYTAIYKAVASGTGDVRYDSLTGTFIEGVDNGDYVYEGMGRNDSVGAVLASNAAFGLEMDVNPGLLFGIRQGILRDITVGGTYSAESEDTTGKKLYFPAASPHELRKVSSGTVSWEARLGWEHSVGLSLMYKPGADYEKKLSSISYFETNLHHDLDAGFRINENHFVGADALLENVELDAVQDLDWQTQDYSARYRFSFWDGFHLEPAGRYRFGDGSYERGDSFDAYLWEGSLRAGYEKESVVNAFVRFAVVQMESGGDAIPYQMMSGYSDGRTYRLEASASADINDFLTLGLHYVLRFGDAEKNVFQKLSTEAKAYF